MKSELKSISYTLKDLKDTSEMRLSSVENRLSELEKTIPETVRSEVMKAQGSISETLNERLAEPVDKIVEHRIREVDKMKNRANILILIKLKALDSELASERKEHDINKLKELFRAICPDKGELELKTCFRLNKKGKPRAEKPPLKAVLQSKAQRRHLLMSAKDISSLADESLKDIIVVRDLTVKQRQAAKRVQAERKETTEQGGNVQIRFGEVVPASSADQCFQA